MNYLKNIINLSALDENDESQFNYDYGVGFSTEYYQQRRASFERNNDIASWTAQYMGEPIERDGALFTPDDFRYYNGELPTDVEPDRIFMAVDPAFGGGDFVASPVCYQYGEDIYVHDVVYDNRDKKATQPLLAKAVMEHKVQAMQVEANKSTESYKEGIEEELKKKGYRLNITTKAAPTDKAPALFAGAFLAHHRFVKRDVIDRIFEKMTNKMDLVMRLAEMYNEPIEALVDEPEESEGNLTWGTSW